MTKATKQAGPVTPAQRSAVTGRYVQRVTPAMVASAQAQVAIAKKLGKTVSPVIAKVAAATRP